MSNKCLIKNRFVRTIVIHIFVTIFPPIHGVFNKHMFACRCTRRHLTNLLLFSSFIFVLCFGVGGIGKANVVVQHPGL